MTSLLEFIQTQDEAFRSPSRLASLYSDFSTQRSSNPDGYAANSQAWLRALTVAAKAGELPEQHESEILISIGDGLAKALQTTQFGSPLALQSVFEDAVAQSKLIPWSDFKASKTSIYDKSWIPTPRQLVDWALARIASPMKGKASRSGTDLVIVESLENLADIVERHLATEATSSVSRIYSSEILKAQLGSECGIHDLSSKTFSILMLYMSRDRTVLAYDEQNDTIKFRDQGEISPSPITQQDRDISSLRNLIFSLDKQVDRLESDVARFDREMRDKISAHNMTAAKRSLRSKKAVDAALQQRQTTLDQLREVYVSIEQAADQVEIIRVMGAAGRTLKTLNKQAGEPEDIRDVMDDLREQMLDTDEISQAINIDTQATIDEDEVDRELAALEQQQADALAGEKRLNEAEQLERDAESTRMRLEALHVPSDAEPAKREEAAHSTQMPTT